MSDEGRDKCYIHHFMKNEIKDFDDLMVWKKAHGFVIEIYKITKSFPKCELFGLISQMRRAAASVTANIAEEFSRYYFKDRIRFYYNSRASVSEVINFVYLSRDLGYICESESLTLKGQAVEIRKMINGLIRSVENLV